MAGANRLDLHEAMLLVLLERKHESGCREHVASELAVEIGERGLYRQKEDRQAPGGIIKRRAERYPALFTCTGSGQDAVVGLRELSRT